MTDGVEPLALARGVYWAGHGIIWRLDPTNIIEAYGRWARGAVKAVEKELETAGLKLIDPGLQIRYRPDEERIATCRQMGELIAGFVQQHQLS